MFLDPQSSVWLWLSLVWGALWGSFGNVFISRWPKEQSVVRPASHCDSCGRPVRWYDNIPILSYLLLQGKCRDCKASIGIETPLVELFMGLYSVAIWRHAVGRGEGDMLSAAAFFFVLFIFGWGLIVASVIDLHHMMLPDTITIGGTLLGVILSALGFGPGLFESVLASVSSFLVISILFIWGYKRLTGTAGMGFGDAKILAMIGAFQGVGGSVFALFAGAIQGLLIGGAAVSFGKRRSDEDTRWGKKRVPFGPFLALGALENIFWGKDLVSHYVGLIRNIIEWVV